MTAEPSGNWLGYLDDDDFHGHFKGDLQDAMTEPDARDAIWKVLEDWRHTAEAVADPARRGVLTGSHDPADFTEVQRPGEPS